MSTLGPLVHVLYDADLDALAGAQLEPDKILDEIAGARRSGDASAALALVDAEISRVQPMCRIVASGAATTVRQDPERGTDLSLYLSDLHCRRAQIRLDAGDHEGARADLLAAQVLPRPHPDAAPLLVEAYERAGNVGYAMSLLSRIHRDEPRSLAWGLLNLVVAARTVGAEQKIISSGLDLLEAADHNGLFSGLIREHRAWEDAPPTPAERARLHAAAAASLDAGDQKATRTLVERFLAWEPGYAPGWLILGRRIQSDRAGPNLFEPTDPLMVVETPRDPANLRAAADAFEVAATVDPTQSLFMTALAEAKLELGDAGGALSVARHAVALAPDDAESHWLTAVALQRVGRLEEAVDEMLQVVRLEPDSEHAARVMEILEAAFADQAEADD